MKTYLVALILIMPLSFFAQNVDSIRLTLNISIDGQVVIPHKIELALSDSGQLKPLFASQNNMISVPKNTLSHNKLILIVNDVVVWAHSSDFEWLFQQVDTTNSSVAHVNLLIFTRKKSIRHLVKEYGLKHQQAIALIGKFCAKGIVNISAIPKHKKSYYNVKKIRDLKQLMNKG